MIPSGFSARSLFRALLRRRDGAVLAWAAVTIPVLLGLGALVIDLSRLYSLQTQLQNAADAAALAAAAELDGRPSSITRADNALTTLAENDQAFGTAGRGAVTLAGHRYLSDLPASDADPITGAFETADPVAARFIEVTVTPVQMNFILPVVAGFTQSTAGATAVAGFRATVCQFTPMFMCNPYEGTATTIFAASNSAAEQRRLIALRIGGGGNSQYAPGNYGFLDSPIGNGANALRDSIAHVRPPTCFDIEGVTQRPGFIASAREGFNVRFDIYNGAMSKNKNDTNYRPARNVVKGYTGNGCNTNLNAQAYGLPRDSCFATDTCMSLGTSSAGRMGAGDWDFVTYLERNHGSPATVTVPISASGQTVSYAINYTTRTSAPAAPPSRYDVYRWEIDNNRIPNANGYNQANTKEKGAPQCHGGALSDTPDRRILYIAVLDCNALTASGELTGGNGAGTLPVTAFARVFLTEPVENGSLGDATIFAEFNGVVDPGRDGGVVHDQVQLYR